MPRVKPVTSREIQAAAQALGINVPIRAATRKGAQIILHTRAGDFAWTPPAAKSRTAKSRTAT